MERIDIKSKFDITSWELTIFNSMPEYKIYNYKIIYESECIAILQSKITTNGYFLLLK